MSYRFALVLFFVATIISQATECHGYFPRAIKTGRNAIMPICSGKATRTLPPQQSALLLLSTKNPNKDLSMSLLRKNDSASSESREQVDKLHRRQFVANSFSSLSGGLVVASASTGAFPNIARAETELSPTRIIRLSSGLQFSDQRVGSGPMLTIPKTMATANTINNNNNANNNNGLDNSDNNNNLEPDDPSIVLMHLRALKLDGSVLLDTSEEGKPLLFRLGSIPSELYLLNEGGALAKGKIPLGVQDAILAQGAASWEGGFGKANPMRTGGIRKVVVPSELAYGTKGVSRYEAFQLGLKQPVARNELLRYEIELLRCNDKAMDLAGSDGARIKDDGSKSNAVSARACCLEEFYPCKMNGG